MDKRHEALIRIFSDTLPSDLDGLYLFSQHESNQYSVIDAAVDLWDKGACKKIIILKSNLDKGYSGSSLWKTILITRGVHPEAIVEIASEDQESFSTAEEAELFVKYCSENGYLSLAICSAAYHQERAFISAINIAKSNNTDLKIYSYPGKALSWNEQARHSIEESNVSRVEMFQVETGKISESHKSKDLMSYQDFLNYLNNR